jgi:hypothetical protein
MGATLLFLLVIVLISLAVIMFVTGSVRLLRH